MTPSILSSFGIGSGIDTVKLVSDLTAASRAPRQRSIDARAATNTARLSAIGQLSSGLATLATSSEQRLRSLAEADIPSFVEDLVGALNVLRGQLADAARLGTGTGSGGPLSGDAGARTLSRALSGLAGTIVQPGATYRRLADIGISTTRDGSLSLDGAKLAAAITADPAAVKALLGVGSPVTSGIARTLADLRDAMTGPTGALTSSKTAYDRTARAIDRDRERLDTDIARQSDRLTLSFSAMDRQIATIKASQAYLTQQIAVWTASK